MEGGGVAQLWDSVAWLGSQCSPDSSSNGTREKMAKVAKKQVDWHLISPAHHGEVCPSGCHVLKTSATPHAYNPPVNCDKKNCGKLQIAPRKPNN
jgi:hypothetical protein